MTSKAGLWNFRVFQIYCGLIILVVVSCRTVKETSVELVKPMSAEKILRRVEQNVFGYKSFTVKRIQCNFSSSQTNTSFQMNLQAKYNDKILLSISKMNIPVGRILLTPESVIFVNYIERNYFTGDYSIFCDFLNLRVDFDMIQSFIENNIFYFQHNFKSSVKNFYESSIEDGRYVLQLDFDDNLLKKEKRSNNIFCSDNSEDYRENIINRKYFFNAGSFAVEKLIIRHNELGWILETIFNDYTKVGKQDYPGLIDLKMITPDDNMDLKIRLSGFSTDKIDDLDLKIPAKYIKSRP